MSPQNRVRLRSLLWALSDLGDDIDPFDPDDSGTVLFEEIAGKADQAAGLARDLATDAHNRTAENGGMS
ncbi:hypothetical protein GCM10009760_04260 [Kitasatospora kazusensis]|uniref:Uncharacterized protein n=1 Tax=Kitasatospora kazusensis TaxID=407974 RepID=A0ABP5KDN6_9ACTN